MSRHPVNFCVTPNTGVIHAMTPGKAVALCGQPHKKKWDATHRQPTCRTCREKLQTLQTSSQP